MTQNPQIPELELSIGAPFAMTGDCALLERNDKAKVPGCCACIQCDGCSKSFRIDLLASGGPHACPHCRAEYTSLLLVARVDDRDILRDALERVLANNGIEVRLSNPDDDDDQEDGGDDDDEGGELGDDDDDDEDDDEPTDDTPHDRNA